MMPHAALAICALAATLTVDENGGGQFTEIQDAIAAAKPRDVILVEPGTYQTILVEKELSILGRTGAPAPLVKGTSRVRQNAGFTLAHLDFEGLVIQDVHGRGQIDDCNVTEGDPPFVGDVLRIEDCAHVVFTRGSVTSADSLDWSDVPDAVGVIDSAAVFVDCRIQAGQGFSPTVVLGSGGFGGAGVRAVESAVVLAGCPLIRGGDAGFGNEPFAPDDGVAGPGVHAVDSTVVIRGSAADLVRSGHADLMYSGNPSPAITGNQSTVTVSGVTVSGESAPPIGLSNSTLLQPAFPEPYLEVLGSTGPGGTASVVTYHAEGASGVLLASLAPALIDVGIDGRLWLGPPIPVALPFPSPIAADLPIPASTSGIEGLTLHVQAVYPALIGTIDPYSALTTNPAAVVVGF